MKQFSFNWKYGDYEIRTSDFKKTIPTIELVKWNGKCCFTLAYYKFDSEGGELRFVGNRPLEHISPEDISTIWEQLKFACEMFCDWYLREIRRMKNE